MVVEVPFCCPKGYAAHQQHWWAYLSLSLLFGEGGGREGFSEMMNSKKEDEKEEREGKKVFPCAVHLIHPTT